jgi:hypothetical protein
VDWKTLLTSTVISAIFTGVIGILIKGGLDRKLEKDKQRFEKEKMISLAETQKDIEFLKSEVGQLNTIKQKNLDYYHSINQFAQSRRVESIQGIWSEYLDLRRFTSPIINFYCVLIPSEYLTCIEEIETKNTFDLNSLNERELPVNFDTVPLLFNLEISRPFIGELLYYKFRSSFIILMRLRMKFTEMTKKKTIYMWHEDGLLLEHIQTVFMSDTLKQVPADINNPASLITLMSMIEYELNIAIGSVVSGEVSADLSLERVKRLNKGLR